uniref:Homeobox domain-containing protein n=1 Tax=Panagrolaimus superbus TaxID=310955 RepID=A0A914YDN3_9BILA
MNIENILSKDLPPSSHGNPSPIPTMDSQMLQQYFNLIMQQSNKPIIPAMPPPSSNPVNNPLLQCNMFFPFLQSSQFQHPTLSSTAPISMPSIPRTSNTYSIENILSAAAVSTPSQKYGAPIHPFLPFPIPQQQQQQRNSQIPDAAYLLNLFTPPSISSSVSSNSFRSRPQPILRVHVTRESSKPLREWMISHLHDPYPTPNEIEELSNITGFSRKQVRDWFTNNRRRYEQKLKNKPLPWKKREAAKTVRDIF